MGTIIAFMGGCSIGYIGPTSLHFPLDQWFLNFFERDPNRDVCKISRPKGQSSIEILKGIAILFTILLPFYYIQHSKQPESNEMPEL